MTDGAARELEQAEARLAEARSLVTTITLTTQHWSMEEFYAARDGLIGAAIEVGRLRALSVSDEDIQIMAEAAWDAINPQRNNIPHIIRAAFAALAARESVQG